MGVWLYVYALQVGFGALRNEVIDGFKAPCGCWVLEEH